MARLEMTPSGVHTRLLLPTGSEGNIAVHLYSGTGDTPRIARFLDGPVIKPVADGSWYATWFCENAVHQRTGAGRRLEIECAGNKTAFPTGAHTRIPPSMVDTPAKMVVLSDIEGNAAFLDAALGELGVIDANDRWTYGGGHLVIAGDAVDRGRDVFAVLWRLYSLSLQGC